MKEGIIEALKQVSQKVGIDIKGAQIQLDYPENPDHGDFSTNLAMAHAKSLKMAPKVLAEKLITELQNIVAKNSSGSNSALNFIDSITVAGPGFINFKIKDQAIAKQILEAAKKGSDYGKKVGGKNPAAGAVPQNVLVEHTDPNAFKAFHIGHLMANAIGESLSRLVEFSGAKTTRICYPSDIGLHIAKSIWAMKKHVAEIPIDSAPIQMKTEFLGRMYVEGTQAYDAAALTVPSGPAKAEIDALNEVIYKKSDAGVNAFYEKGKAWSMEHFELLYKRLGTKFDDYLYESQMASVGLEIVKKASKSSLRFWKKNVFEESEGAIVFKGEQYGLHTRVFINSHSLPTYEGKEVGLNVTKFKKYPNTDRSIIITANEQNDYFKVLLKALSLLDENIATKTRHIGHGMLRFASGKMSSRTGKVITAEALISDIRELVQTKIADRKFSKEEADVLADIIAIGAIKYTILRQSVGSDVVFDSSASISFEGDSGPYLQYSAVRAGAVLEKAKQEGIGGAKNLSALDTVAENLPEKVSLLEKLITRFPDIAERACAEYAPQHVANYLINLAGAFNSFYAQQQVVDAKDPLSPYYVTLTQVFRQTMINGLWLLGIKVPERM